MKEPYASCLTNPEFVRFVEDEVMKPDYADETFVVGDVVYGIFAKVTDSHLEFRPLLIQKIRVPAETGFRCMVYTSVDERDFNWNTGYSKANLISVDRMQELAEKFLTGEETVPLQDGADVFNLPKEIANGPVPVYHAGKIVAWKDSETGRFVKNPNKKDDEDMSKVDIPVRCVEDDAVSMEEIMDRLDKIEARITERDSEAKTTQFDVEGLDPEKFMGKLEDYFKAAEAHVPDLTAEYVWDNLSSSMLIAKKNAVAIDKLIYHLASFGRSLTFVQTKWKQVYDQGQTGSDNIYELGETLLDGPAYSSDQRALIGIYHTILTNDMIHVSEFSIGPAITFPSTDETTVVHVRYDLKGYIYTQTMECFGKSEIMYALALMALVILMRYRGMSEEDRSPRVYQKRSDGNYVA